MQQYRLRLAKTDIGSVAARLAKGEVRSADVSQQVLGTERARGKPVDLVHEPDKGNHGATGNLHGGPTGALVYGTGDHGAASSAEKNDRHGRGRQNTLSTSSSRPSTKGAVVGQTAPGPKRGVLGEWRKQQDRARQQRRVAAAARAPRTVASVLGDSVAARCAERRRAKRALAQARNWGLPARPPANLGLQGVRMAKDGGGPQWGAGAKGHRPAIAAVTTSATSATARTPSLRPPTTTPTDTASANSSDPVHAPLPTVTDDDPPEVNEITDVTDPIHGSTLPTLHQQHAHPLFREPFGHGFYCNMCDASDPPGQRWRCDACDYDICHDCWLWAKPADAGNIVTGATAH